MTATALQFDFDLDAPARSEPVRRPAALTLVSSDSPATAGRGVTLDDVLVERWEHLREQMHERLVPLYDRVEQAANLLETELRKAGKSVPTAAA